MKAGSRASMNVRSVENALTLIELMSLADEPLGVSELARRLHVAPSTAYRLLRTLVGQGFAVQERSGRRYTVGPSFRRLGRGSLEEPIHAREVARPILERVAAVTRESTHLAVLDGLEIVGIDHVEGSHTIVARHPVGNRMPAHATALGQAILAYLPDAAEAVIAAGLPQLTEETLTDAAAFRERLDRVRERGYSVNVREWDPDTAGVAAPVLDDRGIPIACVGISGLARRVGEERILRELAERACVAADAIASRLVPYASKAVHTTSRRLLGIE